VGLVAVTDHAVERYRQRVRDVERPSLVYVCMEDRPRGELIVVTLWEDRKDARLPRKWTRWKK